MAYISVDTQPELFENYARLLICKGINIQPGQKLSITAPAETYRFVRMVVDAAYAAGSGTVYVNFTDGHINRAHYLNNDVEYFENPEQWKIDKQNTLAEEGCAFMFLEGTSPYAFEGVDPEKPAANSKASNKFMKRFRKALDFGEIQWLIAGVSTRGWAEAVFPDKDPEQAVSDLWELILKAARADGATPQEEWIAHKEGFKKHMAFLNEKKFDHLRYTNSKGTNLTVGLPEGHIWKGGGDETVGGVSFFPNMPTEEIFTSPDFRRTEGIVYSALPLALFGNVVKDFWFKFEQGVIVDYDAAEGKEVLDSLFASDEGAKRLGECALVPKESPINQSGVLFYTTLFDENASCHLATGAAFPDCYEGGLELSDEELLERGINDSLTHVDFMIGTDDLCIVGVCKDGQEFVVFENGTWAI